MVKIEPKIVFFVILLMLAFAVSMTISLASGVNNNITYVQVQNWGSSIPFNSPEGIAIGPDGSVYVADYGNSQVQRLDQEGKFIQGYSPNTGIGKYAFSPEWVAVGLDGSVFAVDSYNNKTIKFASNGSVVSIWGGNESGEGELTWPEGIALSPDGSIYVANTGNRCIVRYDANGQFISKFGSDRLEWPDGIAVGPDGSIYVTDSVLNEVLKYNPYGRIVWWDEDISANNVMVSPDGSLYIVSTNWDQVLKYDLIGYDSYREPTVILGNDTNNDVGLSNPFGVAIAPDSSLYITDTDNNRVLKFLPSEQNNGFVGLLSIILLGLIGVAIIAALLLWSRRRSAKNVPQEHNIRPSINIARNIVPHDVFISYSSPDKAIADAVCARLESKRIRCWIAPRDVIAGVNYAANIVDAVGTSRLMVVIYSSNSNRSPHVLREVEIAVNNGISILTFKVEDVPPSPELQYYIGPVHWLDALTLPLENHLDKLSTTVDFLLRQCQPNPEMSASKAGQEEK